MSTELSKIGWQQTGLTPTEKLVLLALCDFAYYKNICWPSYKTLAERCCISRRNVPRVVQSLEKKGLIRIQKANRKNTSCTSNRYILFEKLSTGCSQGVTRVFSGDHQGVLKVSPLETINETINETKKRKNKIKKKKGGQKKLSSKVNREAYEILCHMIDQQTEKK